MSPKSNIGPFPFPCIKQYGPSSSAGCTAGTRQAAASRRATFSWRPRAACLWPTVRARPPVTYVTLVTPCNPLWPPRGLSVRGPEGGLSLQKTQYRTAPLAIMVAAAEPYTGQQVPACGRMNPPGISFVCRAEAWFGGVINLRIVGFK